MTERLSKEGVFQVRSSTTTLFRQPMLPRQAATMRSMRSKCTQYCHQFSCAALVMTIAAAAAVATSSAGGGAAATTAGCARGTAPARIPLAFGVPSSMTRFGAVGRASSGSVSATQRTHVSYDGAYSREHFLVGERQAMRLPVHDATPPSLLPSVVPTRLTRCSVAYFSCLNRVDVLASGVECCCQLHSSTTGNLIPRCIP